MTEQNDEQKTESTIKDLDTFNEWDLYSTHKKELETATNYFERIITFLEKSNLSEKDQKWIIDLLVKSNRDIVFGLFKTHKKWIKYHKSLMAYYEPNFMVENYIDLMFRYNLKYLKYFHHLKVFHFYKKNKFKYYPHWMAKNHFELSLRHNLDWMWMHFNEESKAYFKSKPFKLLYYTFLNFFDI